LKFSKHEIKDLAKAWIAVSLAFTLAFAGFRSLLAFDLGVVLILLMFAIAAGAGFLLHEIAHKYVAQRYGAKARFHSNDRMLMIMLLVSAFGFIFAAPGAVFIQGHISPRKHGHVALAGPMTNVVLVFVFLGIQYLTTNPLLVGLGNLGALINGWLAVFNMLPFGMFDGYKVMAWNRYAWAIGTALAAGSLVLTYFI
jgi:Zn-dependent protease